MFVFYSNRQGCLRSLLISAGLTVVLLVILAIVNGLL